MEQKIQTDSSDSDIELNGLREKCRDNEHTNCFVIVVSNPV